MFQITMKNLRFSKSKFNLFTNTYEVFSIIYYNHDILILLSIFFNLVWKKYIRI